MSQSGMQLVESTPFSPTTISKVVRMKARHYSSTSHFQQFKISLNSFQNSFPVQMALTDIQYHQEINSIHHIHGLQILRLFFPLSYRLISYILLFEELPANIAIVY